MSAKPTSWRSGLPIAVLTGKAFTAKERSPLPTGG